jgi:hypothetical protein
MYTLRIIEEKRDNDNVPFEQVIENHELGSSYTKIKKGVSKEFDTIMKDLFPEESKLEVESLVCGENEKVFFILSRTILRNNAYFIMTDSGKTFERL